MASPGQPSHQVRFGEFELDLQTAELRNDGNKLTLQDQPFQVLALLLDQPGRLVTREEMKERLWSSDTFVDFDHSLNKAVNRLREALCDSASSPRFIETLPRKGYRFICPVETVPSLGWAPRPEAVRKMPHPSPPSLLAPESSLDLSAFFWLVRSVDWLPGERPCEDELRLRFDPLRFFLWRISRATQLRTISPMA
jgi:DNA-binding winged helix-turn-helix (wHTH) protein